MILIRNRQLLTLCALIFFFGTDESARAGATISFGAQCTADTSCLYSGTQIDSVPLQIQCGSGSYMKVVNATYGYGSKTESCSSYVQKTCNGKNSCTVT